MALFLSLLVLTVNFSVWADANPAAATNDPAAFVRRAGENFKAAQARFLAETNNPEAEWQFGRAAFDWADHATSDAQRATIAQQGIAACRRLIERDPDSAPGHYYLAMNLGQLARTKKLGALKIVDQMEAEFKIALSLDPSLDYGGPDRNLGLLYFEAPGWPASIGNKGKARQHFQRALKIAPAYPDNLLNLIEAELKWNDRAGAARDMKTLDQLWPAARKKLTGDEWASTWADWEKRKTTFEAKTNESSRTVEPRRR